MGYVSKLPHVAQMKVRNLLEIDPEFADVIYWRMKKVLLDIIWGELFPSLFVCFFKKITSTKKKVESLVIAEHVTVSNF